MSNKLVKVKDSKVEVETSNKNSETKFNVKDLLILILLTSLAVVKNMYVEIPEFINTGKWFDIALVVISVVGFLAITIMCGSYQSKQQGDNITVASVLRGDNKTTYTVTEKILNSINSLMRLVIVAIAGCLINKSIGLVLMILSVLFIAVVTPKNKFKLMDMGYTAYTVGMLALIFYSASH